MAQWIIGVTREVTLNVEYNGQACSPWGTVSAGFHASTTINRKDWGCPGIWRWRPAGCWSATRWRSTLRLS